jgi:hypothetical protein
MPTRARALRSCGRLAWARGARRPRRAGPAPGHGAIFRSDPASHFSPARQWQICASSLRRGSGASAATRRSAIAAARPLYGGHGSRTSSCPRTNTVHAAPISEASATSRWPTGLVVRAAGGRHALARSVLGCPWPAAFCAMRRLQGRCRSRARGGRDRPGVAALEVCAEAGHSRPLAVLRGRGEMRCCGMS